MPFWKRNHKAKLIQASPSTTRTLDAHGPTQSHTAQLESATGSRANADSPSDAITLVRTSIHDVPLDVLAEIFIFAMHIDHAEVHPRDALEPTQGESLRKTLNPLVLCAVCPSWRLLALSIPKLWKWVFVRIQFGMNEVQANSILVATDLVQRIKRSHSLPLTLYMLCDICDPLDGTGPEAPIISVINEYASRWEALYHQPIKNYQMFSPAQSSLFHFRGWTSLQRICSTGPVCTFHKNETIRWAQITHLQIFPFLTAPEAITILKECPKLEQLSVSIFSSSTMAVPVITMHNLTNLSLRAHGFPQVVDSLSLPSLRNMYIPEITSYDVSALLDLFTRSSCTLDKLEIWGSQIRSDDFLSLLVHTSCNSLTSLKIHETYFMYNGIDVDNKVLRRLSLDEDDKLCPHLKFLTIDCSTKCKVSQMMKMLQSRINCPDAENSLRYIFMRVKNPDYKLVRLDKFGKKSGMEYDRQWQDDGYEDVGFYSVSFRKPDLPAIQLRINHDGFFFD